MINMAIKIRRNTKLEMETKKSIKFIKTDQNGTMIIEKSFDENQKDYYEQFDESIPNYCKFFNYHQKETIKV